jgi:hypothetical protein
LRAIKKELRVMEKRVLDWEAKCSKLEQEKVRAERERMMETRKWEGMYWDASASKGG